MRAIQVTFHDGVLKPTRAVKLTEGQQVILWVDDDEDREFFKELADKRREVFRKLLAE